ncbi:MAG TPA: universal stress protein [Micromonosporaceae bacterium]|nr:universal stress protein [Micromonosporaceae bacterium]
MAGDGGRIVVGVDGSDAAHAALRWALSEARLTGAVLEAVIAWEYPVFDLGEVLLPPHDPESMATQMLQHAVEREQTDGVEVRQRVVAGHAAQVLVEAARGARLLVVGSRGRGTFTAAMLGSVAYHSVQHAPCPIVVVRGTEQ